jgi:tRNA A-37 threonylcarbamoyl transferase component Bud32
MAARVIKTFAGFSGSSIMLMDKHGHLFVRKDGNIDRNLERLTALQEHYPVPKIYKITGNTFDMEYIHGLDMRSYLLTNPSTALTKFLVRLFKRMSDDAVLKDYTSAYQSLCALVDFSLLPFTEHELLARLPQYLPQSAYHGDFTLENLIHTTDGFYMIDCVTVPYDSFIFDIAKMRQDLECHWFLRDAPAMIENKLEQVQQELFDRWPDANNNDILILMLLRVYRHTTVGSREHIFLLKEINRLWK